MGQDTATQSEWTPTGCNITGWILNTQCWGKKKSLSFLPPWEFHTPLSLGTPRLLINLPRKWLSHSSVSQSCPTLCDTMNCSMPPCPSPTPGVHSNSCPSNRWCHLAISSPVTPFSSCLQSFPASESFPVSWLFASGGQSTRASASASVLPMNIQD